MNRRKFIELLNLYIDGEVDPEDVGRLEQKIGSDPEARRIYHQYCWLHRGFRLVYERFRLQVPLEKVSDRSRKGILGWFPARRLGRLTIAASGMAAAIILVSGSMFLMQPEREVELMEEIVSTRVRSPVFAQKVAVAPIVQSFNLDTTIFKLLPASDGAPVPVDWNPAINLHGEFLNSPVGAPIWPTFDGNQWETGTRITYPLNAAVQGEFRVYRGLESSAPRTSSYQSVDFQFPK